MDPTKHHGAVKVLRKPDAKPSNQEANIVMNRTVDWPKEISRIAGPFRETDNLESWLARAARLSGISFWHAKSLFKGTLTDPKYSLSYRVLSAAEKAKAEKTQERLRETRQDVAEAAEIYRQHAARLESIDESFHREQIDVLVGAARALGERNST